MSKRNPDYLRKRNHWMKIVVVIVGILVATISVTAISPQQAYAQNATATSVPPEIVCKMEPTSAECVQPSNSGSSIPAPPSLLISTTPSLLSPSSIPPEILCKMNPNSVVCLQLSKPLVSPSPPSGTHAVPEFGAAASAALLSIAIAGVVIATRAKFGPKIKLMQK